MTKKQKAIEQARLIYDTVRLLKLWTAPRTCGGARGGDQSCELSVPQMNLVHVVHEKGQATIRDLALALGVSAPSVSIMVERLVELGVLTREQNPADRREVFVGLSAQGRDAFALMEQNLLASIVELIDRVGPEWTEKWCEVYQRINIVLSDELDAGLKTAEMNSEAIHDR